MGAKLSFFGKEPGEVNDGFFDKLKETVAKAAEVPMQIGTAYYNALVNDPAIVALSAERMEVCNGCDTLTNVGFCNPLKGGCSCYMATATKAPDKACPKGKWKAIENWTAWRNDFYNKRNEGRNGNQQ